MVRKPGIWQHQCPVCVCRWQIAKFYCRYGSTGAGQHFLKSTIKIERQVWRKFWACNAAGAVDHLGIMSTRFGSFGGSRQKLVSGSTPGRAQSWRLTPRVSSFFAYESLRFVAFAAVSVAAWTALGPFFAAVLINPILCAASACARLKVAMSSAWATDGFTGTPISNSAIFCALSHPAPGKAG